MILGVLEEERSSIIMSTKGASNRYVNTKGSRWQIKKSKSIYYAWAKDFNKYGLMRHFTNHAQEFNFSSKEEYVAHAVKFANMIDRVNN